MSNGRCARFYAKNCKTLLREIKEDLNKLVNMPCSKIERLKIIKILIHLKLIYKIL